MWTYNYNYSTELRHHGIKGQKWGVRRYQNEDGSLTPEGKKRYGSYEKIVEDSRKNYRDQARELKKDLKWLEDHSDDVDDPEYIQVIRDQIKAAEKLAKTYSVEDAKELVRRQDTLEGQLRTDKVMNKIGGVAIATLALACAVPVVMSKITGK